MALAETNNERSTAYVGTAASAVRSSEARPVPTRLTTAPKECLQQLRATPRQNSAADFDRMVQHLQDGMNRTRLGIVRAENQALDAGMQQRAGTHGTRFNGGKQFAVSQAVVTDGCARLAQRHDFGVRCWIGIGYVAVPAPAHDATLTDHDRPDRDFSSFEGALRRPQGLLHPEFVRSGWLGVRFGFGAQRVSWRYSSCLRRERLRTVKSHCADGMEGSGLASLDRTAEAAVATGAMRLRAYQSMRRTARTVSGTTARSTACNTIVTTG